jgi:hypothetical protein
MRGLRLGLGLAGGVPVPDPYATFLVAVDYETPAYEVNGTKYASDTALPGYSEVGTNTDRVFTITNPDATDRDFLLWGKATIPSGATGYKTAALFKDGNNNLYVQRTTTNTIQAIVVSAGSVTVNISQGSLTTGELRWALRYRSGKWSLHTRIGTTTVQSAETVTGIPTAMSSLMIGHLASTATLPNGTLKLLYSNGTFDDAAVATALLAL